MFDYDCLSWIKSILVNEKKGTTTITFYKGNRVPVYQVFQVGDDPNNTIKKEVGYKLEPIVKMAKVSDGDKFDKYTGIAMILAVGSTGSKTKLIKEAKSIGIEPEQYALVVMSRICGSIEQFKESCDKIMKVK